jgi:hypothetical protein
MTLWELEALAPPALLGFVRDLLPPPTYRGNEFLPPVTVDDVEIEYLLGSRQKPVMAQIISWDSEAPIGSKRGVAEKVQMELPPIKRKERISEKELLRFLQPRAGTSDQRQVLSSVYDMTARLVLNIQARVEWLQMQALSEDVVTYDEAGIIMQFDYGITGAQQIDLATQTDGTGADVSADYGPVWTDHTNSTPVSDLMVLCRKVQQLTGRRPRTMVLSPEAFDHLLLNAQIKGFIFETTAPNRPLIPEEVNQVMRRYDLPTFTTYDELLAAENEDGTTTEIRPMAVNKSFLLPDLNVGNTLWGPTAESRILIGTPYQNVRAGIWANTYGMDEPPSEWVKAVGVTFPSMPDVHFLSQMKLW